MVPDIMIGNYYVALNVSPNLTAINIPLWSVIEVLEKGNGFIHFKVTEPSNQTYTMVTGEGNFTHLFKSFDSEWFKRLEVPEEVKRFLKPFQKLAL